MRLQQAEIYLSGFLFLAEVFAQGFAKLQAHPPQARLHRRSDSCSALPQSDRLFRPSISRRINTVREIGRSSSKALRRMSRNRRPSQSWLGIGSPVRDFRGRMFSSSPKSSSRDVSAVRRCLRKLHQRLVHGDANEPGGELASLSETRASADRPSRKLPESRRLANPLGFTRNTLSDA